MGKGVYGAADHTVHCMYAWDFHPHSANPDGVGFMQCIFFSTVSGVNIGLSGERKKVMDLLIALKAL